MTNLRKSITIPVVYYFIKGDNYMRKILAVVLAVCLVFPFAFSAGASNSGSMSNGGSLKSDAKLSFNSDGNFKILVLADVQDGSGVKPDEVAFLNSVLDYSKPDLVVFAGDNICSSDYADFDSVLNPLVERGIPFTLVYGNHDAEYAFGPKIDEMVEAGSKRVEATEKYKEELLSMYQAYDGCLAYDADASLHGCATHNLPILTSDGSKVGFNLWLVDSGDYAYNAQGEKLGYDWVRADQIEWYGNVRDELKAENDGSLVPSMMFQHIIPKEAVEKIYLNSFVQLGDLTINFSDGSSTTVIPDMTKFDGYIFEKSCPGVSSDGQWQSLVDGGDVLGVCVGHDHVNNFVADIDGVDLIQTPGCTYESYYNDMFQGARVIEINEDNPWEYSTYNITTSELVVNEGMAVVDGGERDEFSYSLNYWFFKIFDAVYSVFSFILKDLFSGVK